MARPKINPDYHRKNIALTIDPDLLRRARLIAASKGQPLSRMVEELLLPCIQEKDEASPTANL